MCDRRIGFAIAKRLAEDGAKVMVSSRKEEKVRRAVEELRKNPKLEVEGTVCHVGNAEHRTKLVEEVLWGELAWAGLVY